MIRGNRWSQVLMLVLTLILAAVIVFSYEGGVPAVRAAATSSGSSCYVVVSLDRAAGFVTVKNSATGTTQKLQADSKTLAALRVGMVLNIRPAGGISSTPKTESCGSNVGRNEQTRLCQTTDPKTGRTITYKC